MDPISLGAGLVLGGGAASYLLRQREHRQKPRRGLTDLLPYYMFLDERTVLNKDGSFMRAWSYRGPDMATATDNELNTKSEQINAALKAFGDGWMFHVDAVRKPSTAYDPGTGFRTASARVLDLEREQAYAGVAAHFETLCYFVVTFRPPTGIGAKIGKGLTTGSASGQTDSFERQLEAAAEDFAREVESLEDRLGSIIKLRPLAQGRVSGAPARLHHRA